MKYDINHEFVWISSQSAKHRIILIHGWGADAKDLLPISKMIIENSVIDFEVISIQAPSIHPNNSGRQWYKLYPPNWEEAENEVDNLRLSLKKLDKSNIPLKKTILIGFSQGAAMAIDSGCNLDIGLIIACSGFPHPKWNPEKNYPPILISHGLLDDIVPINASQIIFKKIKSISENICEMYEFEGYHQIDPEFIKVANLKIKEIF